MKTITFNLNCQLEERLRKYTGRKGQLSKILNEAVELWLNQKENTGEEM
jgi:predicted DNA-binding protein